MATSNDATTTILRLDVDADEPEYFEFDTGEVVVYSRRCPDKETPNEDGALVVSTSGAQIVLAVADGCGGMNGGDLASRETLQSLQRSIEQAIAAGSESLRPAILDGIEAANANVLKLALGAATTLAAAEVYGQTVRPYHIGDSQILLVGNRGKVKFQTGAHSPVGYAIEAGVLSEDEAMHHEDRHLVSNVVGDPDCHIEIGSPRKMSARDTLFLGTDGIFDNLPLVDVCELVRKGRIMDAARQVALSVRTRIESADTELPSKPDDATFVLFRRRVV